MDKKTILVTGCSSGLGPHIANKFEQEEHSVLRHQGRKHFDISNIKEVEELAQKCIDFKVNMLINNAAIGCPSKPFSEYNFEEINYMIDVNLRAPILLSFLLKDSLTNIININSMVGLEVKKNRTLYSATKWGLRGFSNSLEAEQNSIKILSVYPTNIKTNPNITNAMEIDYVVESIYDAFLQEKSKLVLDGRPK